MKRRLVALMGLSLVACGGGDGGGAATDAIKLGAIFDFTGATADVGTDYAHGVQGYVEWRNARGGVEGRPIDLVFQDYGYRVDRAEQLYTQFVQEGVVAFMGWGTGDTEALRGRIAADEIPFTSASLSHLLGDASESPYNFLIATTYSDQLFIILDWIQEDFAAKGGEGSARVAFMHHASPFGLAPWNQGGAEYAASLGIEATAYEMPRGATDFTAELTRIRESGAQYVVFQNTSAPVALVLKNARSLGLDVQFVCQNWCSNELLTRLAGEAAEGVVGAMPFAPLNQDAPGIQEIRAFLEARGESIDEKSSAYVQGWWTTAVMVEGIRRVVAGGQPLTGANIKAELETLEGFDTGGATVPISFTPEDHRGAKGLRLYRVEEGQWRPLTDFRSAPERE